MIQIKSDDALKKVYTDSQIPQADELFLEHVRLVPHLIDFSKDLKSIVASLETKEDDADYQKKLDLAKDFLRKAVEAQSPTAGTLIQ